MAILVFLALLFYAFLGVGSGSGSTSAAVTAVRAPTSAVVTQADTGHAVHVARGRPVEIDLSDHWKWSEPRVVGPAVVVQMQKNAAHDPAAEAWLVVPRDPGTVTVRSRGGPGGRRFRLTIHFG